VHSRPEYAYLTFDCYGTLIDWKAGIEGELVKAAGSIRLGGQALLNAYMEAEKSQESNYQKYREVLRRSVISMAGLFGVEVSESAAREFAASVPRWPVFPDTVRFLRDMGARGYKRYILSNVDDDLLEATIASHGLEVDGFVTAEEVGSYKPNPAHWVRFMEKTGATKDSILHCAQSVYHDLVPAGAMGIASAWVNRYDERLPSGVEPSFISHSLEGLAKALG